MAAVLMLCPFILTLFSGFSLSNYTEPDNATLLDTNVTLSDSDGSRYVPEEVGNSSVTVWTEAPEPELTASPQTPRSGSGSRSRSATAALPLALSGTLPAPVTAASEICPCNVKSLQCDINCCCDPDCTQELALFTQCTVQKVVADPKRCSQDTAIYTLSTTPDGLSQVRTSVKSEVNPDVFCIQSTNYEQGLTFVTPKTPTEENFDYLFSRFVGFSFGDAGGESSLLQTPVQGNSPGYLYGDVMQTVNSAGQRDFFRFPASAGTAHCVDSNPAAFLQDQSSSCVSNVALPQECTTSEALNLKTYTDFHVFSGKDKEANLVSVEVQDITLQSLEGTQTLLNARADLTLEPVFLQPAEVCNQVVLQVRYTVRYGEVGQVVRVTASLVLGAVSTAMLPIQQEFHLAFVQEGKSDAILRSSGNPGYVVGLPLVAGWRTPQGMIRSSDPAGSLTVLQSSEQQDCLSASPQRSPVLFGKDVISGCTFRLEDGANCSLVSEAILGRLKGQNFPDYVASFGNSLPENPLDWVPIGNQSSTSPQGCSVPLSYHLEIRWTKFGTLINPQAQIVSVTGIIRSNASTLPSPSTGSVIAVSSSVRFIDVSASASPGFRVPPTINAKLPFDFFFPFV